MPSTSSDFMSGMAPKTTSDFREYKFPAGFVLGVGLVSDLQQALQLEYTSLSGDLNQLNIYNNFYLRADDKTISDTIDSRKETTIDHVKSARANAIKIMVQIMQAEAQPAPPCPRVDAAVSLLLQTPPMAAPAIADYEAAAGVQVGAQGPVAAGVPQDPAQVGAQDHPAQVGAQDPAAAGAQVGAQDPAAQAAHGNA